MRRRTLKPRAWSNAPSAAEARPLPRDDTTPPVMKTKRAISVSLKSELTRRITGRQNITNTIKKAHERGSWAFGLFGAAAYCEEAGVLAGAADGVVEAEDDGAADGLEAAEDDELGKMDGAEALCEDLAPTGARLTLALPSADGNGVVAACEAGMASGFGILVTGTTGAAAEDDGAAEVRGSCDRLLAGAVWAFGVEASGRSFSDGAEEVLAAALEVAAVGATGVPPASLDMSTWSTTEVPRASRLPTTVMARQLMPKAAAKTQVSLVRRLPAPRADMKPDGPPPMPSAPPSDR